MRCFLVFFQYAHALGSGTNETHIQAKKSGSFISSSTNKNPTQFYIENDTAPSDGTKTDFIGMTN